jgi:hypothetical protein
MSARKWTALAPLVASAVVFCGQALAQAQPPSAMRPSPAAGGQCVSAAPPQRLDAADRRSVVVTELAELRDEGAPAGQRLDLSFGRTLGAIVASMPGMVDTQAERIALMTSLIRSFRARTQRHPEGAVNVPIAARPGEEALDPIELLNPESPNGMRLVGAFNRLDLAPVDWSNCGEHRLVYAKGNPVAPIDRMTLIFEARVDNPNPEAGAEGCRPVAEFWDSLRGKTGRDLTRALEAFYFRGDTDGDGQSDLVHDGQGRAVIDARHLGLGLGQVRGNIFVTAGDPNGNPWQLREWRVAAGTAGAPVFEADTVKQNPIPALYGGGAPPEGVPDPDIAFNQLRAAFGDAFVETTVSRITSLDRSGLAGTGNSRPVSMDTLLNAMGAGFERRFDAFVSVSQTLRDDPTELARGTPLEGRVAARLAEFVFAGQCGVTAEHVLNRAGAMSCGGCHQFSGNRPVAQGITWPTTRALPARPGAPSDAPQLFDFVHVDEAGQVSPALEDRFLPERRRHLETLLAPPPVMATAPSFTGPSGPLAQRSVAELRRASAEAAAAQKAGVRESLGRLRSAETRRQALETLTEMEGRIATTREQEARQPGAFMPYRRVH